MTEGFSRECPNRDVHVSVADTHGVLSRELDKLNRKAYGDGVEPRGFTHLGQRQDKSAAACKLLALIYGWFAEGFDTVNLGYTPYLHRTGATAAAWHTPHRRTTPVEEASNGAGGARTWHTRAAG
jgi:hypothetical protein